MRKPTDRRNSWSAHGPGFTTTQKCDLSGICRRNRQLDKNRPLDVRISLQSRFYLFWRSECLKSAMLHTLVSTVDKDSADVLKRVIRETGHFVVDRAFSPYPSPYELSRALSTLRLDVAFLDVTYKGAATPLLEQIRSIDPSLPVIGFSTQTSLPLPSPNLAGFMDLPLSASSLSKTTREAIRGSGYSNYANVTAILPAKAGGGATTIAINAATSLARSFGKRVLVVECDLQSGTIGERIGSQSVSFHFRNIGIRRRRFHADLVSARVP